MSQLKGWPKMEFSSVEFLLFATLTIVAFHLNKSRQYKAVVLALASAIFISSFINNIQQIFPFIAFLLLGYGMVELVRRTASRAVFVAAIAAVLLFYIYLKRFFFLDALPQLTVSSLVVGLSYILFRILHLIIDTHAGEMRQPIRPLAFFNYTCNFLTFVSGPIQRYQDFDKNTPEGNDLNEVTTFRAFTRIINGFFKVLVISAIAQYVFAGLSDIVLAANTNPLLHDALARPENVQLSLPKLIVRYGAAVAAYTTYLYFNFAGYMDIVIGIGGLVGQDLPENFDHPFLARNFLEFWQRWHMTLSQWFKDYLFNPLVKTMMVRFPAAAAVPYIGVAAFFLTFLVMGVWHGTTAVFVVYGLLMGAGASVNKLWQLLLVRVLGRKGYLSLSERLDYLYFCRGLTTVYFAVAVTCLWVDIRQLGHLVSSLGLAGILGGTIVGSIIVGFAMFLWDAISRLIAKAEPANWSQHRMNDVIGNFYLASLVLVTFAVSTFFHRAPEFVYRAF